MAGQIFEHEAFSAFSDGQKRAMEETMARLNGKNPAEAMPVLLAFAKRINLETPVSEADKKRMIEAFMATLSETERQKFTLMLKMMGGGK